MQASEHVHAGWSAALHCVHLLHRRRNRGGRGGKCPPLFSEKAVNIINTYTFILGAEYFSPPHFLHASSTTVLHGPTTPPMGQVPWESMSRVCSNHSAFYSMS